MDAPTPPNASDTYTAQLLQLQARIDDLQDALGAIRAGGVDAVVLGQPGEEEIYTLSSADRPYRLIVEEMGDGAATLSPDGTVLFVNRQLEDLSGRPRQELLASGVLDLVAPQHRGALAALLEVGPGQTRRAELELLHPGGAGVPVLASVTGLDLDGVLNRCLIATDLSSQRQAEAALALSEQRYHLLAENASDVVWQLGADGRIQWVSESVTELLGWSPEALLGLAAAELVHPDERDRTAFADGGRGGGRAFRADLRIRRQDGGWRWMASALRQVQTDDGLVSVVALRDIQDNVNTRQELEHAIQHDLLTGLATRPTILARIANELADLQLSRQVLAVLNVGVDGLADVNAALSHTAGDQVITAIAARIATTVGNPDQVGRGTGDEFIVLLPNLRNGADAAMTAERIRRACQAPVMIGGNRIAPTVSIGIATSGAGTEGNELLRDASLAMRQAKQSGHNCYQFIDAAMAGEARSRLALEAEIRRGLAAGEFQVWFMPIVAFASGKTTGYEALVRWCPPQGPVVEPGGFLPVAERSGLINAIDLMVLRQSVATLTRLPEPLTVAVNVVPSTLLRCDYPSEVVAVLEHYGVSPTRLHLEITETSLLEVTEPIQSSMDRLAAIGVSWYVDDFGTGYSSISHLRDLPIAGLKLDRSFTNAIPSGNTRSQRLAQALVGIADGLALDTVAEGVSSPEEAELLAAQGWTHGQGWLYGKAAPLP